MAGLANPVLTAEDVTDVPAWFVADPFMVYEQDRWYMFFEVWNEVAARGEIGLATSTDGLRWTYRQIVLRESFHLSYPYVFKWQDNYYMLPETRMTQGVCLYKADAFPTRWTPAATLIEGDYADASITHYQERWWLFVLHGLASLRLFHAEDLAGPWQEHPRSPLVTDDLTMSRPGGRLTVFEDKLIRFAQKSVPVYGYQLRAFQIDTLTPTEYAEHELEPRPVLTPMRKSWNAFATHHADPHLLGPERWIACVDGATIVPAAPRDNAVHPDGERVYG